MLSFAARINTSPLGMLMDLAINFKDTIKNSVDIYRIDSVE